MPHWEGIEDTSATAAAVWLSRSSETDCWKPLRKIDCQTLNKADADSHCVYIEGGRSKANPVAGLIHHNFIRGSERQLTSAIWFIKEEKGKEVILHPVQNTNDTQAMEELYQKAVEATSSLGNGIESVLKEEVELSDQSKIRVNKAGDVLTLRKIPNTWLFANSIILQRGYGAYEVPGEFIENQLGPVRHLVFVIHGIGEALFSREEVKIAGHIDQTSAARMEIQRKQYEEWKKQCSIAEKQQQSGGAIILPPPPNRIELIPIEWFSRLHDSSSELMQSLKATTLTSIPALRAIANDVVFDVLMYLTPAFCEAVLETVTAQINDLFNVFQQVHPDFLPSGGKCSLAGHSLGSVICWDLLAVLKQKKGDTSGTVSDGGAALTGYQAYAQEEHAGTAQNGTWGPSLTKPMQQTIPFTPEHAFFLGSPLGIFLTLRGAHPVFDEMRKKAEGTQGVSPFTLPTKSLYNIFHPSDPVAYRIEPLLLPQGLDFNDLPPPAYLTVPGKDVRLHVKAKQVSDVIRKSLFDQKKSGWGSLLESAASALGNDAASSEATGGSKIEGGGIKLPTSFPLGGTSYNCRVDFSLQPGVIDNEYISAVMAHSCYFTNQDFLDFATNLLTSKSVNDDGISKV